VFKTTKPLEPFRKTLFISAPRTQLEAISGGKNVFNFCVFKQWNMKGYKKQWF
jgi:hypothetical protein